MANPEHLAKLKEGIEAWNAWRKENPKVIPSLNEASLGGVNLTNADFTRADLYKATLTNADFTGADLYRAILVGANFFEATLAGANFFEANLTGATLTEANLTAADLRKAKGLDSDQLCSAFSLVNAKLDDALKNQAMTQCPEKFKEKESRRGMRGGRRILR